jgi:hypothetical protein
LAGPKARGVGRPLQGLTRATRSGGWGIGPRVVGEAHNLCGSRKSRAPVALPCAPQLGFGLGRGGPCGARHPGSRGGGVSKRYGSRGGHTLRLPVAASPCGLDRRPWRAVVSGIPRQQDGVRTPLTSRPGRRARAQLLRRYASHPQPRVRPPVLPGCLFRM